jgi:hypothetical protein
MLQNCVMNNHHEIISIVEQYLDINNIEYQSFENNIEIYPLDKDLISINITDENIIISCRDEKYFYNSTDNYFEQIKKLVV